MQQALRPYATVGVALVGASMIAVTPVVAPPPDVQVRQFQLADTWSDLITDTTANVQNIINNANFADISSVFAALLTNPVGVIGAFTNVTPDVTTDLTSLPATISVQLPPGLELAIASMGSVVATDNAIQQVIAGASSGDLSVLINGLPTILNAYYNGQDNISLLDGTITIPAYNGILAPLQPMEVDLSLTNLVDALGLGNTPLTDLDLSNLLDQLGLGTLNLGGLFSALGLSDDGLGTLLADATNPITTLGGLLSLLGVGDLGLGQLSLTGVLSGLGLDTNVDLNNLSLDSVLSAFGIDPNNLLSADSLLSAIGLDPTTPLSSLTLLDGLEDVLKAFNVTITPTITNALNALLLLIPSPSTPTIGGLLSELGLSGTGLTLSKLLSDLGIAPGDNLSIGTVLQDLGFSSLTGNLTLSQLLGDLGNPILGLNITGLLNGLNLGDLLNTLDLSNLPLNLSNLGDLSNLNLGDLLGDLGLGNLANITVDPFGGYITELVDVVPQQILAALG